MTHKTRPIQLPIDPAKAHLYVARNGVGVKSISKYPNTCMVVSYPFFIEYDDGKVYSMDEGGSVLKSSNNSHDLTHEIIPEAQNQPDLRCTKGGTNQHEGYLKLRKNGDLSEIENAPAEELELVVGELYEWDDLFDTIEYGELMLICGNEAAINVREPYIGLNVVDVSQLRKHTPPPAVHEVEFWVNVYGDNEIHYHPSKEDAEDAADLSRIACLHFKRTFTEGEGL